MTMAPLGMNATDNWPSAQALRYCVQHARMVLEISGFTAPGFERVREQFERNFTHHREVGASVCVYRGDECVVDLWGGVMDPELSLIHI